MRQKIVPNVWCDEVEAIDDEAIEWRTQAFDTSMLCGHSAREQAQNRTCLRSLGERLNPVSHYIYIHFLLC